MSWLLKSSIGKKLIMSVTGIALILFLFFHAAMNVTSVFSEDAFNTISATLGANWYAVAGTIALGALVAIHFIYALILTIQNRKARGNDRYAVSVRPKNVEWASQNMFVLGVIIVGFMVLHLSQFWYKMMFAELMGNHHVELGGAMVSPQDGAEFIKYYFSQTWVVIAYLIWYVALWFHLSHGFWSAIHTIGWDNKIWMNRLKVIGQVVATILCLAFAFVTIYFYARHMLCPLA